MTERAKIVPLASPDSPSRGLFELQVEQHRHDEAYHREIARLSLHQRLNHMALHFAKYAGKIAACKSVRDSVPILVDTRIIALSTANILNTKLWDTLALEGNEQATLFTAAQFLAERHVDEIATPERLVVAAAKAAGRMAAACEKIDHLESVAFRTEIVGSIGTLANLALAVLGARDIEPAKAVRQRLEDVKKRSILHGKI